MGASTMSGQLRFASLIAVSIMTGWRALLV